MAYKAYDIFHKRGSIIPFSLKNSLNLSYCIKEVPKRFRKSKLGTWMGATYIYYVSLPFSLAYLALVFHLPPVKFVEKGNELSFVYFPFYTKEERSILMNGNLLLIKFSTQFETDATSISLLALITSLSSGSCGFETLKELCR